MEGTKISNADCNSRKAVYDWLRLIATIFVVVGHSVYLFIQTTYGGVAYELPVTLSPVYNSSVFVLWKLLAGWVYGFHMPLFFMLSGAVLALRPISTLDSIVKSKAKRLLIPYFVYGWLFMLPIKWIGNFYNNDSIKDALRGFLSGLDSGHLWFLPALFWCFIVFVIIKKILVKCNINSVYAVLLICGIIQLAASNLPFDILSLQLGLSNIFYFSLGYVLEYESKANLKWTLKMTIAALAIACVLEIINIKYEILNAFFTIIVGCSLSYLLADLCDRLFKNVSKKKWWQFLIGNLFYVYLFHDPLEYLVLRLFMGRGWLSNGFGCIAYALSRTVLIFFISILLGECVRRIKKTISNLL